MNEVDFVIVGSGSAGSALAYRLGEDGRNSIAVIEFGGSDFGPMIQMPSALSYPMNFNRYNWGFITDPEPGLGGRRLATPRGKVVGGSSSINGMVYVRGHALDFDHWEEAGATGWGFRHVLPYFQRLEAVEGGEPGWRGNSGPLRVSRAPMTNPLYRAFIEAGRQAGYPVTRDYNGSQQEGFATFEQTIWKGERYSAAKAYLRPALKRGNAQLIAGLATRVVFDGKRATGVEVLLASGDRQVIGARCEVIIAASAINSPKLLMLSGVGPAQHLKANGVNVLVDRPGVGGNLQDHLEVYFQAECLQPITLNSRMGPMSKARIGAEWLLLRRGLGATNHFESCAFIRSTAGMRYPDIQYHFLPGAIRYDGTAAIKGHGFQVHVGPMRSKSRGQIRLRGNNPAAAPSILFNYMSHPDDWTEFRTAIGLTREIFAQDALRPFLGREIAPGASATSDAALDAFVRDHAESAYHPCGSCRMGAVDDPLTVVDPQCRVIGVEGLRVADSSIFPRITNGNLNAPSIMTGEKAADHILGREPLAASNQQPWINPNWQTQQR